VPAGEPVLGSSSGDGQLVGDDLENSNAGSRHARQGHPHPGGTPGKDDQPGARPMSRLTTDLSPGTYVLNPDTFSRSHRSRRVGVPQHGGLRAPLDRGQRELWKTSGARGRKCSRACARYRSMPEVRDSGLRKGAAKPLKVGHGYAVVYPRMSCISKRSQNQKVRNTRYRTPLFRI
jgi:hypothetical protein